MQKEILKPDKKLYLTNLRLIIISFLTVFYPRIVNALGAPKIINFLHFIVIPCTLFIAISTTKIKDKKQIIISWEIIIASLLVFGITVISALLNRAGVINVFLNFMILVEPFLLMLALICIPLTPESFNKLRNWLLGSALINLLLAYIQKPLIDTGRLSAAQYTPQDAVQGVFYISGAGNYVSCSVSLAVALYYFVSAKNVSVWFRGFWLFAAMGQLLISDSKQVLIVFVVAWAFLIFTKVKNIGKIVAYLIAFVVFLSCFYWAVMNLEAEGLSGFKWWLSRTELYGPDGEAVQTKMLGVNLIISYYKSPLNWLFGLGPGHTLGRLGGWFLRDYWDLLAPLGATTHPVSAETWQALYAGWLAKESSMFMPLFSWVGIWGDLGFLGLAAYLYLGYIVWNRLCVDDFCKFLMLSLFVFGLIFTQMEEIGQTVTVAILIGLQWHERQRTLRSRSISYFESLEYEEANIRFNNAFRKPR